MSDEQVDLDLKVPEGLRAALSQLSAETGDSEADLLLKSVALLVIALRAKRQGKRVVIATTTDTGYTTEPITGL